MKHLLLAACVCLSALVAGAQERLEWYLAPGVNVYLPINHPAKAMYPVIGYSRKTAPSLLIGGFQLGLEAIRQLKGPFSLKGQLSLSKTTCWDGQYQLFDAMGFPVITYIAASSDYLTSLTGTLRVALGQRVAIGTGLGVQGLLVSLANVPAQTGLPAETLGIYRRYGYKRLVAVLPAEVSYRPEKGRVGCGLRAEYTITNRLQNSKLTGAHDRSLLLFAELTIRI